MHNPRATVQSPISITLSFQHTRSLNRERAHQAPTRVGLPPPGLNVSRHPSLFNLRLGRGVPHSWKLMDAFDQLASMPGLRELLDLGWRLFGVNPAPGVLRRSARVDFRTRAPLSTFLRGTRARSAGWTLCAMCDQGRFLEARRNALALRYRCHAGLTEFIVPVVRDGEIVALLQCGQVHDRRPSPAEWRAARRSSWRRALIPVR